MFERYRMKVLSVALVLAFLTSTACSPGLFRFAASAVITTAVVAAVIHAHDSHFHHEYCGHKSVLFDGREVYHYQGRWEYYDSYRQEWYVYDDLGVD